MFIGIVGSICAGKSAVAEYLIEHHGFTHLSILREPAEEGEQPGPDGAIASPPFPLPLRSAPPTGPQSVGILSSVSEAAELHIPTVISSGSDAAQQQQQQQQQQQLPVRPARARAPWLFHSANDLINFVTKNWREHFVTDYIPDASALNLYMCRPFFLLVSVDAPLAVRWERYRRRSLQPPVSPALSGPLSPSLSSSVASAPDMAAAQATSLIEFVALSDAHLYGPSSGSSSSNAGDIGSGLFTPVSPSQPTTASAAASSLSWSSSPVEPGHLALMLRASVQLINPSSSLANLYAHLAKAALLDPDRLRPSWDTYFMMLASLAARRSNCMKRRVGCVVSLDRRVVSTGYNGTPCGMRNCNEGGCPRCNEATGAGVSLATCLCLHAEENALIEVGRERLRGGGAVLYCDTCPCPTCSVKIVQAGIVEVVYSLGYHIDAKTAGVFSEAGVRLRQVVPPDNDLIHLGNFELQ